MIETAFTPIASLAGGVLIGIASTLLMLTSGPGDGRNGRPCRSFSTRFFPRLRMACRSSCRHGKWSCACLADVWRNARGRSADLNGRTDRRRPDCWSWRDLWLRLYVRSWCLRYGTTVAAVDRSDRDVHDLHWGDCLPRSSCVRRLRHMRLLSQLI